MKQCFKCLVTKNIELFYLHSGMIDGRLNKCIDCSKIESRKAYALSDKKHVRKLKNAWNAANIDKVREGRRLSVKRNSASFNARTAKRRATALNATPKWLNKQHKSEIKEFYILAKELQWLSEERLEVDHIIPLVSDLVCGLHVPWNLQILPKSVNVKKGNRF